MYNNMVSGTIAQYSLDKNSPMGSRYNSGLLFTKVLTRTKRNSFWHKLIGKDNSLKDLSQVEITAKRQPTKKGTFITIPLNKIVGSEGRKSDFDRNFNPLNSYLQDRWIGIATARRRGIPLPPVELIQVGDEYYVRDGHHRISVANALGQAEIEAQILYALELN